MRAVLLLCLYYLVVTPVGVVCRILRDPLRRRIDRRRRSYLIMC